MISPFTDLVDADFVKKCNSGQITTSFISTEKFKRKFLDSPKSLKKAARKWCLPVSHPIRRELWPRLINRCCNAKIKIPNAEAGENNSLSTSQISSDSPTSNFSSSELTGLELADRRLQNTYHLNQHGRSTLRFLLHELSVSRPDLVYAPQTWTLLALLLHFYQPQVAVACLNAILNVPGLLIQTKGDWRCSCLALEYLGASGFAGKRSFKHFLQQQAAFKRVALPPNSTNNVGKGGRILTEKESADASSPSAADAEPRNQLGVWPITVWQLPFEYIVPLVDCFIVEGPKVLFRAGLVLWHLASKEERRKLAQAAKAGKGDGRSCDIATSLQSVATTLPPGGEMRFLTTLFRIRSLSTANVKEAIRKCVASQSSNAGLDLVDSLVVPCILPGQRTYTAFTQVKAELEIKGRSSLRSPTHVATSTSPSLPVTSNLTSSGEIAFLISGIKDDLLAASYTPVPIFSTETDGCSLSTLFKAASNHVKATGRPETILLVRTLSGKGLVGAYCTLQWEAYGREQNYYGNGRSFLFRLRPPPAVIYHWDEESGKDSFQRSSMTFLEVGGGMDSSPPGLRIDANLEQGESGYSSTYASQCLITFSGDKVYAATADENQFCSFKIGAVELLGFKNTVVD